jgi:predicted anti-sigma-YlaC factor YlaD
MKNKTTCFHELAYAMYVDGETEAETKQEIETHLQSCTRCRELVQQLETENAQIKKTFEAPPIPGPDLAPIVMEKLAHDREKVIPLRRYRWVLTTAATFLLAVFLLVVLVMDKPTISTQPGQQGEKQVILCTARVEGHNVQTHIYKSNEPDIQFIWLEKEE